MCYLLYCLSGDICSQSRTAFDQILIFVYFCINYNVISHALTDHIPIFGMCMALFRNILNGCNLIIECPLPFLFFYRVLYLCKKEKINKIVKTLILL